MRLDNARLCLDCEEIHEEHECPACGSEAFAFLKRWIKTTSESGRRGPEPRSFSASATRLPASSDQLDAWRRIVDGAPEPRKRGALLARGLVGLAAMGLAGLAWKAGAGSKGSKSSTGSKGSKGSTG